MPSIVLTDLTRRFGEVAAVDRLSLEVRERDFMTLLGPSGCGKTTTLRMIAGLETPDAGRIEIEGEVVFDRERGIDVPANRRHIGLLFQNYALWPNMTVYQNIAYPLAGTMDRAAIDGRVREAARSVQVEEYLDRWPAQLSGGQQQRVAIARTLAPRPRVILMDEPLSNLDARLRLEMRAELQRLHLATGCTFLYVTHDQLEAMTLSTRICLLEKGVMRQCEAPLTVYRRPADRFVAGFVGSPPVNFVEVEGVPRPSGEIALALPGEQRARFRFCDRTDAALPENGCLTLGIRPEMLVFGDAGLPGEIYSVLPAGMETTVQLQAGPIRLTAVVFGDAPFAIGARASLSCRGEDILLFRRDDGALLGAGTLAFE